MASTAPPIILITSINPFSRVDVQLRCFQAWKAIGADIVTANIPKEAEMLKDLGLTDRDIVILDMEETGQSVHGKPVPLISAVLRRLHDLTRGTRPAAIINSDLYPAMRSSGGLTHWLHRHPAVALTREECPAPELHRFQDTTPYRGGLDMFVFRADVLAQIITLVERCESRDRMSFGIPGWDYVIGAIIQSEFIGGIIADGALCLHESHATTYANVDEFSYCLGDMERFAGLAEKDTALAAYLFKTSIEASCDRHIIASQRARVMFYQPVEPQCPPDERALQITETLIQKLPLLRWADKSLSLARLAAQNIRLNKLDFEAAQTFFDISPDPQAKFSQALAAILFCLECAAHTGLHLPLTRNYPASSLHGKVITIFQERYPNDEPGKRLEFARLFGAEMISHNIFNPRIYNYLLHCCETDDERALLIEILTHVRRHENAA